jgi:hypothetical protein
VAQTRQIQIAPYVEFPTRCTDSKPGRSCAGQDWPAPYSLQIPDSPGGFLESWQGLSARRIIFIKRIGLVRRRV